MKKYAQSMIQPSAPAVRTLKLDLMSSSSSYFRSHWFVVLVLALGAHTAENFSMLIFLGTPSVGVAGLGVSAQALTPRN